MLINKIQSKVKHLFYIRILSGILTLKKIRFILISKKYLTANKNNIF